MLKIKYNREKGWSFLGMLGVLAVIAVLGFGGNYIYMYLHNVEKADNFHNNLRNIFLRLSDVIGQRSSMDHINTGEAIANNVFPAELTNQSTKAAKDYWGNQINIGYHEIKEPVPQNFISYQTLISGGFRVQICETYLRLLENYKAKNYLRLIDTVMIVDRGNPMSNIKFCSEKSTENCRGDEWASLSDLNGSNRRDICKFYCKTYPCMLTILLTQN